MPYKLKLSYFKKIWNDQKYILLWLSVFLFAFEFAFAWLLFEAKFNELFDSVAHMLPPSLLNFIGVNLSGGYYGSQMLAFGYSHPLILYWVPLLRIMFYCVEQAIILNWQTFGRILGKRKFNFFF